MKCYQCPRSCGADRSSGKGLCGVPDSFVIARAAPHFWEEPCISGTRGSGAVFFSGCSLRCVFCQNYQISTGCYGKEISDKRLMEIFDSLIDQGVHNINLVNPTHYATRLADVLRQYNSPVPVVYNCGGYEKAETLKALEGLINIWLPDIKYIEPEPSRKYSGAADYFEYAETALEEMYRQAGENEYDSDGIMKKGVIVRHLILPKNTVNSIKVLDWLNSRFGNDIALSLMAQYTPCGNTEDFPELNRRITQREYDKVSEYMYELGFKNGYIQQRESSEKSYIPAFDLTGI